MSTDIENLKIIYGTKLGEFKEGGFSEEQVKAFEKLMDLLDSSGSVDEWKAAMESQNVWFEISKAQTIDTYTTKRQIMQDTIFPMLVPLYDEAVEKMRAAETQEEINEIAAEADEKIDAAQEHEQRRRSSYDYCFTMVYRYHISGVLEYNYKMGYRERLEELGGLEELREMASSDLYKTIFPFPEDLYEQLLVDAETLTKDEKAYTFTDEEQKLFERFIQLYPKVPEAEEYMPDELQYMIDAAELCKDCVEEAQAVRNGNNADEVVRVFMTTEPTEKPGLYEFEKILEFDYMQQVNDEKYQDKFIQAFTAQTDKSGVKENTRDKIAMLRRGGLI